MTEWKDGYITGIQEALDLIDKARNNLIVIGGIYYVIMFHDGNPIFPYIEKMKMFRKSKSTFSFTKKLDGNILNVRKADVIITIGKEVKERVFFSEEDAQKYLSEKEI